MAEIPTLEQIERAILDIFKSFNKRGGESLRGIGVLTKIQSLPLTVEERNAALDSMGFKNWIKLDGAHIVLTEEGFKQL